MKELQGYIIAESLIVKEDTITLVVNKIFFNKADAQMIAKDQMIFKVSIPYPQDGQGNEWLDQNLFPKFWAAYPNKKAKPTALKMWERLKVDKELYEKIMVAIEKHKNTEQWTKDGGKYIPHPATWLHQMRWEDDVEPINLVKRNSKFDGI